jgi:hypothetical protein
MMALLFWGVAFGATPERPSDPTLKEIEIAMEAARKKCDAVKNPMARIDCQRDQRVILPQKIGHPSKLHGTTRIALD